METTPNDVADYLERMSNKHDDVQAMFRDLRHASLHGSEDTRRRFIDMPPNHKTLYRKMSLAEWNAAREGKTNAYNFEKPFEYTDSANYRLWFSTSLDKVRLFGNENASTTTDVIICFDFSVDVYKAFKVKCHQEPGVQHNPAVVAMHREGFLDFLVGMTRIPVNMNSSEHIDAVLEYKRAYNLGFTASQKGKLKTLLVGVTLVT
jgi:hypothetical protein